ncbi:amidase [Lysobacter korlensis]|uniref:Amidase n=1 Tax=Lysobacter korlensis TaxID=553636 RepID=A0ABV6RJW9_9GAMM
MEARPSSLLAIATAVALLAGCAHSTGTSPVARAAAPETGAAVEKDATAADPLRIAEADIADVAGRMQRGELSSEQLTQAYLDRIAAIDDAGPRLNAVIEINPDAIAEARRLDAERRAGTVRGPLHGVPVLVKDNIDATPMVNSAGSMALAAHRPSKDAPIVEALRAAGAVVLGKTNLSEWANFRSTRSTSGWSGRGGQTRNPYVLDRSPCGSSSGTGAAIAASLATVGVGTETDGSILCPSAVNGLVGLKPTVGLVGRSGIIPISASQDTAGPMTRSVADAAALLEVLASAKDAQDRATTEVPASPRDYTAALRTDALRGARIGVVRKHGVNAQPDVDASFERALSHLREAGAVLVDVEIPTAGKWNAPEFTVLKYEFKDGLERYLRESGAPVKSLAELVEFNRANAGTEMPYFGQELLEQTQSLGALDSAEYRKASEAARRLAGREGIDAALAKDKLDALVAPTTGPAWPIDLVNGDNFTGAGYGAAAVSGYPSLTVPMGNARGLPLGITFMGSRWSEARLLGLGYAFEQRARERRAPTFVPTLPLP